MSVYSLPKKYAILHDAIVFRGGAERYNSMLASAIDADFYVHSLHPGGFNPTTDAGFQ
jgi:hypothetical protein